MNTETAQEQDSKPEFNAGLSICETCGNSTHQEAAKKQTQSARLHHYRHALYLACGDDKEKVKKYMSEAEDTRITF